MSLFAVGYLDVVSFAGSWANAPFAVAAGIAAAFALLQVTGILGLVAGDHGGDADADHDVASHHQGDTAAAHVPFSILWQTFALAFAAVGFALNLRYLGAESVPLSSLAWTVPSSLLGGYLGVTLVARVLGPVLSSQAQEATSRPQLVGQTGVVISTRVDEHFGEVRIRDKSGHDLRVVCRLAMGATEVPLEHQQVVIVDCEENGSLIVETIDYGVD